MDPFLEGPEWESFHAWFVADLSDALMLLVQPRYVVRMQRRDYIQECADPAMIFPPGRRILMREPHREPFARILSLETREVVTVIELLSPANKREGTGRRNYLEARERILRSAANLVEVDLLRGGLRLPSREKLPPCDYCAIVSRAATRPRVDVYLWSLREMLPVLPIPLRPDEPDVLLQLQPVFERRYDRGYYQNALDYSAPLEPPLSPADAAWAEELLQPFRRA